MIKKYKKIIFTATLLIFCFTLVPQKNVQAYVAWPDIGGAFFRTMLDQLWIQIRAALIGALKKKAIDTLSETVNDLVGGDSGEDALFVTDWEDYLFKTPEKDTNSYMNDFFTLTSRGRSSGSYSSSSNSTDSSSYSEWRSELAKSMVETPDYTELQDDFTEYADSVEEMFDDGTWAAYNAFMQPNNNPISYALITQALYSKKLEEEKEEAATKAESYDGFKGKEGDNGNVITPGSVIEGLTVAANTMDNDAIANARNLGEVAGIVVGKIASNVIKEGLGNSKNNQSNSNDSSDSCNSQSNNNDDMQDQLDSYTPDGNIRDNNSGLGSFGDSDTESCN